MIIQARMIERELGPDTGIMEDRIGEDVLYINPESIKYAVYTKKNNCTHIYTDNGEWVSVHGDLGNAIETETLHPDRRLFKSINPGKCKHGEYIRDITP